MSRPPANLRIRDDLAALAARGEGAFMPFIVIGDPDLETSLAIAETLCEAGADIIEFGFPFSDPPADGPVIQAADQRALRAGTTPSDCFAFIAKLRARHDVPVALLLYFNLVMQRGVQRFYADAAAAGVDAVLVADVPLEHAEPLVEAARANGIAAIFIASELSSPERLGKLAEMAQGYVYAVARIGTTGEQSEVDSSLATTVASIAAATDLPILAGFGIATPEHVRTVLQTGAHGAIVGSAIVRQIGEHADGIIDRGTLLANLASFCRAMKAATIRD